MKVSWTFDEWLTWMQDYRDSEIELGLSRVQQVGHRLEVLNFAETPVVVVAGTNGKGSCIATMEAILLSQGCEVASYTSPHLFRYNERIRMNAVPVAIEQCCQAFEQVAIVQRQANLTLTFFEFSTLAALYIFKYAYQPDVILLEVGLGGRLDAVNAVAHGISVITSIGWDHMDYLGDTLPKIAAEKAGIIQADNTVICGKLQAQFKVTEQARLKKSQLLQLGQTFDYESGIADQWQWRHSRGVVYSALPTVSFPLQNAAVAVAVVDVLAQQGWLTLQVDKLRQALSGLQVPGRFQQQWHQDILWIFDVAHNCDAVKWLCNQLAQQACQGTMWLIMGFAATKKTLLPDMLQQLQQLNQMTPKKYWVCPLQKVPCIAQTELQALLPTAMAASSVEQAVLNVAEQANTGDSVVVFGSFHTVAEGLSAYNKLIMHNEKVMGY